MLNFINSHMYMNSNVLIILFISITVSAFSQHKTEVNSNGDRLSEVIDADNMKQGIWTFYNAEGDVVRIEKYEDNQLKTRESLVLKQKMNTIEFRSIPLYDNLLKEIRVIEPSCRGEFLVNELGEILDIHFYGKMDSKTSDLIRAKIKTLYHSNFTNVIINF